MMGVGSLVISSVFCKTVKKDGIVHLYFTSKWSVHGINQWIGDKSCVSCIQGNNALLDYHILRYRDELKDPFCYKLHII